MKIVILENTTRGLNDFNQYIRDQSGKEVWVFTETQDLFDNSSKNKEYFFIIDMLTPGVNQEFVKKLRQKYPQSQSVALTNSSNDALVHKSFSAYFSKIILKNPSMGNQVINFLKKSQNIPE